MISVKYSLDNNTYTYLSVKGHADSDEYGKDLICASVSSIMFGLMNCLDGYKNVSIKEKDNHIEIINASDLDEVNNYLYLTLTQLKTIEESYKEFIKVERK